MFDVFGGDMDKLGQLIEYFEGNVPLEEEKRSEFVDYLEDIRSIRDVAAKIINEKSYTMSEARTILKLIELLKAV